MMDPLSEQKISEAVWPVPEIRMERTSIQSIYTEQMEKHLFLQEKRQKKRQLGDIGEMP